MFTRSFTRWLSRTEAHHRLAISLAIAAIFFLASRGHLGWRVQLITTWNVYALCVLVMAWARILTAQPRMVVRLAKLSRSSRTLIYYFVIVAACASLAAVAFVLSTAKTMSGTPFATHIALAIGTVILSWLVVHTMFAQHYAHVFYSGPRDDKIARGLIFPEGDIEPDYLDFAYFSFVIGMTSQVSDVQINSREIRRLALLHGLVSFGFNTAVLALSINIISGLF
jgi:uncharacterized membrane protein